MTDLTPIRAALEIASNSTDDEIFNAAKEALAALDAIERTPSDCREGVLPCPFCGNEPHQNDRGWFGCPNAACPASVVATSKYTWNARTPAAAPMSAWQPIETAPDEAKELAQAVVDVWKPPSSRYKIGFGTERTYIFFVCANNGQPNYERTKWMEVPDALHPSQQGGGV